MSHRDSSPQLQVRTKKVSLWAPLKKPPSRNRGLRTSNPKTRTGCRTCKSRRVKCDESKPNCKRCQTYGVLCGGYCAPREKHTTPQRITITAKILPKDQRKIPRLSEVPPIMKIRSGPRFENDEESGYFHLYREEIAVRIVGSFTSSLWGTLIPQASEVEPFIRHAIVAVGALAKLEKDRRECSRAHGFASPNSFRSTYALRKYHQAIHGLRELMAHGAYDAHKVLIACILVFCFETMQGNLGSAISHAEKGLMLFYESVSKAHPSPTLSATTKKLERQMVEGDLMHAYAGLDLYIMFWRDTRSEKVHRSIVTMQNMQIAQMPTASMNITEARMYFFLMTRRNHHFFKIAAKDAAGNAPRSTVETGEKLWDSSYQAMECMMCSLGKPSPHLREENERYKEDMRRWSSACSALFKIIPEQGTPVQKLVLDILKIHAKTLNIVMTALFFSSELEYDVFLSDFRQIVALAKIIHPQLLGFAEGSVRYHYGWGVNYPLFLVGVRCRDRVVRDEAIKLLGSRQHREGTWDATASASIAGWVRDVEMIGKDRDEFVPERRRVFFTNCNMDLQSRKAFVRVGRRTDGGIAFRKALITW